LAALLGTRGTDGKALEINDVGAAFVCVNFTFALTLHFCSATAATPAPKFEVADRNVEPARV
jgi:hypothetical protein